MYDTLYRIENLSAKITLSYNINRKQKRFLLNAFYLSKGLRKGNFLMKRTVKLVTLLSAIAISTSMFAGCAKENAANGAAVTSGAKNENASLRFSWWGGDSRHKATLEAIDIFTKDNPNIKIEGEYGGFDGYYQKLTTQIAGGTAPDIIQLDQPWIPGLVAQADVFVDINTLKDKIDLSGFDKTFLEKQLTVKGKLQGLPAGINGSTIIFNKTLLEKMGVPANTKWDWENLIEIGKQVHDKDKKVYLLSLDIQKFDSIIKAIAVEKTGQPWVSDDYKMGFDKALLTEALTYIRKLVDNGVVEPFEQSMLYDKKVETNPKWANQEAAAVIQWPSTIPLFEKGTQGKLDVAGFPVGKNAKKTGVITRSSQVFAINAKSTNVEAAAKFLNAMYNDDRIILALGSDRGIPATTKAKKLLIDNGKIDERAIRATDEAVANSGDPETGVTNDAQLLEINRDIIQAVGFNKSTPEKAADELIKRYTDRINELKNQK